MPQLGKTLSLILGEIFHVALGVLLTLGFAALALAFAAPIKSEHYLFFGIGAVIFGFAVWVALMRTVFRRRDTARFVSTSIAVLATSLAFLVIVPVTIERSITVFLLQDMARTPGRGYMLAELEAHFRQDYLYGRNMLGKRIVENSLSGLVRRENGEIRLTKMGTAIASVLGAIGRLFSVPIPRR